MSAADSMIDLSRLAMAGGLSITDLPDDVPGVRMELIDGSLVVTPLGDWQHQGLIAGFPCTTHAASEAPPVSRASPGSS